MADNVNITPGTGATVATDDIGGVQHQRVKVVAGADGTAVGDLTGRTVDGGTGAAIAVDPRPKVSRVKVSSAGLTTATTAYVAGDQLGTILEFTNAVRSSGGSAVIQSATLVDDAAIVGAVDLFLFDRSVTLAADNAAAAFSDADMQNCLGVLSFVPPKTNANNGVATLAIAGLAVVANATSLFGALVTRAGHTFFGAVDDLTVSLVIAQD